MAPRLREAKAGKRAVYFVDAAHFVFGAFLGYLWCWVRFWVRTPSGRKRFNVLAALNAVTSHMVSVSNDTYINAMSVCELLHKIAAACPGMPITLFLDNARYQKCALVQELATSLKIELAYLPSYSPNLNLIERFWKFVKKRCLYSKYYSEFIAFQAAITDCIASAHTTHRQELKTLLTHNFQSFEDAQFMTV